MNTDQILALLSEKNLALAVDGDELIVRGEKQRLDASLIALVRENKQQLLDSLRDGGYAGPADVVPPNGIPADCTEITPEMLPLVELTAAEIAGVVAAVPGGAANVQDVYPLAPLQEGMLFHHLLGSEGDPYLSRTAYRFETRERLDAYLRALQFVIDRHDALRTAFLWEGLAEPVQVVLRRAPLAVEELSLDPAAGDAAEQLASRFDPRRYRLDVRQAPLLRACIAREPAGGWSMVLLQHHLWGDNASLELMQREIEAHLLGTAAELPPAQPFRNFIARFGGGEDEHEAFFRELLGDVEEPTAPFGLIDVQGDGAGTRHAYEMIDAPLARRLRACARAAGVSTASICHVAWARVLARVSGRTDVVFGSVLLGRMQGGEGADRALGMFMNTLPVRIRVDERGVREAVEQAHVLLAELLRHEHAPLALAQRCSAVPVSTPLFSSLLNYRHSPAGSDAAAHAAWQGITVREAEGRTNYPIGVSLDDYGDELSLLVKSDASVDPSRLCRYMQTSLARLVEALDHEPLRSLASIDVLPAAERHELLVAWNATDQPFGAAGAFVHELFEAQAAAAPTAVAVEHDGARLTYGELNARANRLARHLRDLGVRSDMRVGVCIERSPEMVVGLLAVLKAGGAYVPLDPGYPPERLSYLVQDSAPALVLTNGRLPAAVRAMLEQAGVRTVDVVADAEWADRSAADLGRGELSAQSLAYVIYTSGSTGNPKGVMVEHRHLAARLLGANDELGLGRDDVFPNLASPAFDIALFEVLMPLISGGRSLLLGASQVKDVDQLRALTQHATVFHAVPSLMEAWLQALSAGGEAAAYPSLRTLLVGGEAVPERLLLNLTARFPHARVIELYGPTEAVIVSTRYRAGGGAAGGVAHCIGRPFANTRVYILNAQMEPAPVGVAGELHIGGLHVARGYLHQAGLTAERFVADPFVEGDRLYKTGDLARYLPDGNIEFLGRGDFQVKIRGFRIELGEIEAQLAAYPGVREAVVVALADAEGEKRLVAYYTADAAADITVEALREHLLSRLPDYMVPAAYVPLESLPLTSNGKLDRKALPAPDGGAYGARAYEAPAGDVEMTLAVIWRELLGIEQVGRNDNFFELGGHSLLVVVALERLRRVGLHVDAGDLFAAPTLRELAAVVQAESLQVVVPPNGIPADCAHITPEMLPLVELTAVEIAGIVDAVPGGAANVQDIYPLAPLQEGVLVHHLLGGEGDPYLSATGYRFESRARFDAYLRALQSVIERHDILRTAILWEGLTEPVQVVLRHAPLVVEEVDLDPAAGALAEQLAARFNPRRYRLDVRQAPVMRVCAAHDATDGSWSVVLLKHHLLGDHTASELMQREVEAFLLGTAHELPAPQPFRNFIAQARLGVSREEHEAFFRELLGDVDEPTAPFGLVDVRGDGSTTRQAYEALDPALAERVRASARALGVSTASLCHVAWARVLARVSGRSDVVFGTLMFGRMQGGRGAEHALGMFMNTLPVRIPVDGRGVRESVEQTHHLLAQMLRHEHAPLALAQRCSAVPASTPLFSSLLNYRHIADTGEEHAWAGITVEQTEERTNYPIGISVNDFGSELSLSVKSDASVDPQRVCAYMETSLAQLADALERSPKRSLSSLEVLPAAERRALLVEWNATERPYPADAFAHELFAARAAASPEAVAVEHDGAQLRYGELNARANRLARHLRSLGVRPEMRVAVCIERSLDMIVALLGVLKAGGAYLPLDPSYPIERLSYLVGDSAPALVLTHGHVPAGVLAMLREAGVWTIDIVTDARRWADEPSDDPDRAELRPDSLAYVIYTSGSTGNPKGVMVEHHQFATRLLGANDELGFGADDVFPNLASPAFDIALFEVFMPLISGGRSLLLGAAQVKDIDRLRALTQDVTVFHAVPSLVEAWLEALGSGDESAQYVSLRTLLVGGEAVPERLLRKLTARFPRARVFEMYGPTESVMVATRYRADGGAADGVAHCIGRPFPNTRVYVLDAQLQPAPIGVAGELYVGGLHVARGYLNRAELTAERFVASPFVSGDRLYKTGDRARYLPDGNVEFLGRTDFQVKVRGFRIELGEIEAKLAAYPGVRESVVVAIDGAAGGESGGEKRLVAYYTADAGAEVSVEALRAHLLSLLPEYMVPAAYVPLESLPLTSNGKLDRKALPAPDGGAYASRAYEAPEGDVELTIAAVWRELLGIERVGRNDNFFELGGHSLLVVVALERLRRVGLHVDAGDLFSAPTLSALAAVVREESLQVVVPPNGIPAECTQITPEMLPLVALSAAEIAAVVGAVPGGAANVQDVYPLAPLQEGMLFHHMLGGDGDPYLTRQGYRFESRARLDAYVGALQAVIDRHDILRTAILWEGLSEPVQVVLRHAPLVVEEIDVDPAAGDVMEQLAARFNPRHHRLDLRQAPLMRAYVAREPAGDGWSMVLLKHHVLGDQTAMELMHREVAAHLLGAADALPASQPFRNFIAQARLGISSEEHEAFFRELLGDVEEPTAPYGLIDVQGDGASTRQAHQAIEASLAERLRACARALGVSTASVCHVAWARVLARVSGRNDVVFGTLLFGRMLGGGGTGNALGMFMNTLPVRIRVDERSVRESVEQAHLLLAQLLRHEHAPLALTQRCSAVPVSTPLFSSLLNYRHGVPKHTAAGEDPWKGIDVEYGGEERTNYPIGISVNDHGDELGLSVKSDSSVDPERLCGYMQTSLAQLVDALEHSPARSLASIEVLPASERHELLVEWNATDRPSADALVHELFETQAERWADAIAVEHDGAQLCYGELNARANRLARHLRNLGVRPDMRVGVCIERSLEMIVALLGVLKAGGAYVPLDPSYPLERLAYLVQDSAPALVLTHDRVSADVHAMLHDAAVPTIDVVADAERWADEPSTDLDGVGLPGDSLAYVIYTSGSTGNPKGVMVEHRQLASRLLGASDELGLGSGDVFPNLASPAFDIALFEVLMPLLSGGRSLLLSAAQVRDIGRLRELTQHATVFHAVPSLMEAWLEALGSGGASTPYASLHTLLVGGEAVPERLLRKLTARFPHTRVFELYGPTEAVMVATRYRADGGVADGVAHCIGRPFANTRVYVLDAQMQPAPVGVAGELYVGGLHVARGYLNRTELTAERFVPSPFVGGDRLYKTGDLARYLPDGNVEFLGRTDFQVKVRGFRIELGEIEAKLATYLGVREAVVVAVENAADEAGNEKRLVAYYTAEAAAEISVEALRAHLLSALPEYMVPAAYVPLESLPLTSNGKLDRKALPAPDGGAYASRAYEAPEGDVELTIAAVWRELLGIERVGRNDNFFELGGHSLLVVVALERLRRVGLHVDAGDLFSAPTLSALASVVREESLQVVVPPNGIPAECTQITPEMLPLVALSAAEIAAVVGAVPGGAANVQDVYPLAPLQEGMLFHHMLGGDGDPYLTRQGYRFESRARLDAYVGALQAVIDRHDILRTAILWEGLSEPVQVVLRHAPLVVEEVSVDPAAGDVMEQLAARFSPRRFRLDVRQAPIMRAYVAREPAGGAWSMVLLKHHLLGDQTAMELMHREVAAHLLGTQAELPASQPFRNFIAQARLGISSEEHEAFFRELLGDVEEPTAPYGLIDVQGDGASTRQAHQAIEASLAERLRACARALGVSTASVCHVAWARVLARVSGRTDVVFGTLLFGRMQGGGGTGNALGMFMNTLPVRIRVDERSVRESVEQAHLLLAQLLRHEHAPLALTQRCSAVPVSTPLFSSLLNYRHGFTQDERATEDAWKGIDVEQGGEERTNYPIGISVNDHGDELGLSVKSDSSVDPDRLCGYMQTSLAQLVDALENSPARSLASIDVLPASERHELLVEWNATDRPYADALVHELFEVQAERLPDAIAVEHDGAQVRYGELNARANRLAQHLQRLGIRPDMRVGVCIERSPEMIVALLAVLKAGGAYVPLDPSYPLERLAYLVGDSAPALVLTHDRVSADVHAMLHDAAVQAIDVVAHAERWADEPSTDLDGVRLTGDSLAYVIYTSGSTGAPKGVMVEHRQLASRLLGANDELGFSPGDVFPNLASPAFDIALFEVLMPLISGARSVLLSASQVRDIGRLRELTQHATVFHAVPSLMEAWLEALDSGGASTPYASLHTLLVGGEAVPERLLRKLTARFPHARVFELYGPTEAVIVSTRYRADGGAVDGVAHCIGRPFANTRTYILDAQLQPAPVGVGGELYVGGLQVARGYLNRTELTAERFVPSPFVAGDRLYKTGDLARYLPDGNIEFLGRTDFQVKVRGFRIELGEIEAKLATYPGVREAVVVAAENAADEAGNEKRLVAYYTAEAAAEIGVEALRAHLLSLLPEYMVPAAYVPLESLPLTSNGKLDRKALPAPDGGAYASRAYEAPEGDVELTIAAVWRELLGIERVGRNDNFFELGGHSLLVVVALERLRRVGLHVDAGDLFSAPTLSALASVVREESLQVVIPPNGIPAECTQITPEMLPLVTLTAAEIAAVVGAVPGGAANVQDVYPLAPLQEGMLFHHMLGGDGDPYLTRQGYRFESRARLDAYVGALQAVIDRHDILRTAILWEGLSEPVQVVLRHAPLVVEEIDVDPAAGDVMEQLAARFSPRRFRLDVRQAPLLRAFVTRQAEGDGWSLVLLKHHVLGDQTTMELMHREVAAHLLGTQAELPASQPFRNFIAQARLGISSEEHEAFFRELLGDVEEPTAPYGLIDVQGDGSSTRQAHQAIEASLAERLRACARALGVSTASVCHVAWARVLARVSGRTDVVFGTLLFGRMQGGGGTGNALGMFMNTLPVRIRVDERSVRESVEQAHLLLAQLLRHEHAPLALTQRCSAVPVSTPLFSSLLNYRHGFTQDERTTEDAWEGIDVEQGGEERTNYPIGISVNDHGDELGLSVKSDSSVDPERLCGYMQTSLAQLVDALENSPARSLASIDVLPASERHELLVEWNATDRPYADALVHELFEAQAERLADAIAVEHDGAQVRYGELNARANRLARHLQRLGIRPDMRVGVCIERSLDMIVALLAVLKAGGAYVPLDPSYPLERLAYLVGDSAPALVLTHDRVSADVHAMLRDAAVQAIDVVADAELWSYEPSDDPDRAELRPDSLAYVIYTSGSTGNPKGVMVEHRQLASRLLGANDELGFESGDVFPNLASPAFDIALFEVLMPLISGGRSVLLSASQVRDIGRLRELTQHATVFHAVPSLMEAWLEALDSGGASTPYASLHTLLVGGEAVPERLLRKLTARFPHARVFELYGPTEAVIVSTRYRADGGAVDGVAHCIGRPFANTRVYVLDGQMQPAPVGVAGELYVGGLHVARGYLNRTELTAERFVPSPFVGGDRLYKTGDLARYLPDGNIEFLGRSDFQVKIRGFRIELGEIEAKLATYPGVREAVVVAIDGAAGGESGGEKRLVAYYTADAGGEVSVEALRAHLLSLLPEYMVPAAYVPLESLPLTSNGKLDRKALPAPDGGAYASRAYEAPEGEVELTIAAIWSDLLDVERVGRNDNFFELGGHSLLVVAALERLRRVGLHVEAGDLFALPSLRELAAVAREESLQVVIPPNGIPAECTQITPEMVPLVKLTAAEIATVVGAVPGGAANVQDIYPLAPLQEGMLFHHMLGGEGDPYLGRGEYEFESRERLDAYLAALHAVIERHDILRTALLWEGLPEPVQVVLRHAPLVVEEIDLDPSAGDVMKQLAARFNPRHYRLDLRQAPLMRAGVARQADSAGWSMVMLKHHMLGDQTASELMQREVAAHLLGTADALPASQPFRNFVAQARLGVSREEHTSFFRELLGDVDEPTAPFGLVNVQGDGSSTRKTHQLVDAGLAERLRACARALGVSTASVCHVAWARVLARVSGRNDVVFGTVLFGRMQGADGGANALGMFMNTLPVRIRVDDRSVRESVKQAHLLLAQLLHHEHAPLALTQRCSAVPVSTPLFSSLLNYRHGASKKKADGDAADDAWQGITAKGGEQRTNYPVGISVNDHGDELSLSVKSDASIDPDRLCGYVQTALAELVDALTQSPARSLLSIDVLPQSERHELLVEWNATDHPYAAAFVHELFETQAEGSPDAVAVEHDGAQVTYGELNARANRLARHLQGLGLRPEMRVGVCIERSLDMIVALLAVLKAGGAYVPLDSSYPLERLAYLVDDSAPALVLTHGQVSGEVHVMLRQANVWVIDVAADAELWSHEPAHDVGGVGLTASSLAYVIYTSGSTGNPKGVMVEHRQLASRLLGANDELGFSAGDVFPNLASPAFDIALFEVLMPLISGGRSLLLGASQVRDIGQLRELTRHATVFHAVPSLMEAWLEALGSGGESTPYASLHTLLVGGEAVPERLLRKLIARFPHARVFELYGPTEAVIVSTRYRADGGAVDGVAHCIGRPFANTRTYILDAQLQPAPIGVAGELYVGGLQVARGYLNRTELTAERFVPSPFVAGDRLYKTGDLARYLPGGNIEFLGRSDFQVKIRGFRIELGEIEAKLATYPGVRAAVVVAVDGAAAEDAAGEKRLVAYYTAEAGAEISVEALRAHLLSLLPEYMVPAAYVPLESLPLTSNGKLDRKALPAPDGGAYVSREYEAPADEMERALASIWRELLNVERVGRNDDFFEIGGHSLLAMGLLSRVRDALQVEVDLNELFSHPTLREFARALKTSSRSTLPPIVPVDRSESIPLSFAQERLWFLAHLDPTASRAYHLPFSLPMKGELDVPALRRALDDIVARHESLRTTFTAVDGEPAQRIGPADSGFHLVEDDLRGAADAAGELKKLSAQHAGAPFDFETGPLVRGRLVRLADDEHVLMVATHHIVSDGWSMGVFMRELRALYAAYSAGEPSPLAPLAVQYADYAVWQRRWISGETLQEQASYWQRALADAPVLLELPTDRPRPAVRDPRGGRVGFALDAELTARVKALSRRHGATLYMTLLAAWGALLSRLSGQEDVVIGTAVANRVRPETEPLIGFFANTLPVRLNFAGNPTLGELLERVKAQAIAAQEHQDVPFEHIVELVNPPRSLSHSPLFQAMFLWQNMQRTERALPGLKAEPMDGAPTSGGSAQFDLTLDLSERGDRIAGSFSYVTALFDRATIERYGGYLQRMIAAMVADD